MDIYKRIAAVLLTVTLAISIAALPAAAANTALYWNGQSALSSGCTYYIDGSVSVSGSFTLPASSKIMLSPGSVLTVPSGSSLTLNGNMTAARGSQLLTSGELVFAAGSDITISGELLSAKGGSIDISGDLVLMGCGYAELYGDTVINEGGRLYCDGGIAFSGGLENSGSITLSNYADILSDTTISENGSLYCAGTLNIKKGGNVKNSGTVTLGEDAFYLLGGTFLNVSDGYVDDDRNMYEPSAFDAANIALYTTDAIKGIDVSIYQDDYIDWNKVKASGVEFVMIRSSIGYISDDVPQQADLNFAKNAAGAIKAGLNVGVYHYLYAETVQGARDEAKYMLNLIKDYPINYPVVLDIEDSWYLRNNYSAKTLTDMTEAFCDEIRDAGYLPMVYSYANWLNTNLNMDDLNEYPVWVAHVDTDKPAYDRQYFMWQYSWEQKIPGITDENGKQLDVDGDYSYVDFAKYIKDNHLNGLH